MSKNLQSQLADTHNQLASKSTQLQQEQNYNNNGQIHGDPAQMVQTDIH